MSGLGGAQGAPAATSHHDARGAASAQTMEGMARGHMDTLAALRKAGQAFSCVLRERWFLH